MLPLSNLSLALIALAFAIALPGPTLARGAEVPAVVRGRALVDATEHQLKIKDGARPTLIVFLSARCPCSASHEPVLADLAREYGKEVSFIGVHSNADEPLEETAAHFKSAALPFPVIQDEGARLANAFGALKTPHAFLLSKEGRIVFQGGVDDSHVAATATRPYLKNALESMRAGRTPEVTLARSIGCVIRR